jgi:hypothetical protein
MTASTLIFNVADLAARGAVPGGGGGPGTGWLVGGNDNGAGTSVFGTADTGDLLQIQAAGVQIALSDGTTTTFGSTNGPTTVTGIGLSLLGTNVGGSGNVLIQTGLGQSITVNGVTGDINVGTGAGGADANNKTGRFLTGTGTKIGIFGSVSSASSLALNYGTGNYVVTGPGGPVLFANSAGQVAVNSATPDASAGLDLHAITTLGLGLPQVPDATLLAIASPLYGLVAAGSTSSVIRANVGTSGSPNYRKVAGGPLVRATNTSGQSISATTSTTVTGWTSVTNVGANFVPSTGIFTAPIAGFYSASFGAQFVAGTTILAGAYRASLTQTGSASGIVESREVTAQVAAISAVFSPSLSTQLQLAAADTLAPQVFQGTGGALALSANAANNTLAISLAS